MVAAQSLNGTIRTAGPLQIAFICWVALVPVLVFAQDPGTYDKLRIDLDQKLSELAHWCDEQHLESEAAQTHQLQFARDPNRQYFFVPFDSNPWPEVESNDLSAEWSRRLQTIRREHADQLFAIAKERISVGDEAQAYTLLHEACTLDPEHLESRRILGYQKHDHLWQMSSTQVIQKAARSRNSLMGWSADEYLIVESPHYQIVSTAGADETLQLANQLERWRVVWRQVFFNYWSSAGYLKKLLNGKSSSASRQRHKVVFFGTRDQYVRDLEKLGVEGVAKSTGFYSDRHQAMFFYLDSPLPIETWRQEQAHQLFQEAVSARKDPVEHSHVWALEGIAMYYESLVEFSHFTTLGGFEYGRLQYARVHWTREKFFVPFDELTALGQKAFQMHPEVGKLYSQSAGMTHFLMSHENGKYRSAMLQLVKLIYQRRAKPNSLAELCGVPAEQLEREYKQFLTVERDNVNQFLFEPQRRTELALGFSNVDSSVGPTIADCKGLRWLQLSSTNVDDAIGPILGQLVKLEQLFLDKTQVTDETLASLSKLTNLEELDLAETLITDEGMTHIAKLTGLKALWLGGTQVTDRGLEQIASLKNLQLLDVKGTAVTPDAIQRLKKQLPQLK